MEEFTSTTTATDYGTGPMNLDEVSRSTRELAASRGANVPGDSRSDLNANNGIVIVQYAGHDIPVYTRRFTGEVQEYLEVGMISKALKILIGDERWNASVRNWHMKDVKGLLGAIGKEKILEK